jgi:hypothetical protein
MDISIAGYGRLLTKGRACTKQKKGEKNDSQQIPVYD